MIQYFNYFFFIDNWPLTSSGFPSTAGTTASIAIFRKNKLYVAHCGDSGISWAFSNENNNTLLAEMLTIEHKPESEEEHRRIVAAGGKVAKKGAAEVHRVVWFRPRVKTQGPVSRNKTKAVDEVPFLAVGRSLGDLWSYNPFTNQFVVSPDPDCAVYKLDPKKHKYFILGTDGLWNAFDHHRAVELFHASVMFNSQYGHQNWQSPADYLVQNALTECRKKGMRADNITVIGLSLHETTDGPLCAIFDHEERIAYNLNAMDSPKQLPPFEDVAQLTQGPSTSYYRRPAFVNACCYQNQRYVFAESDEIVDQHYDIEHHRIEYESMLNRPRNALHYAYQPVEFPQNSLRAGKSNVPSIYYVPPTPEELEELHRDNIESDGEEFAELTELLTPQSSIQNEDERAETPIMDESDEDETDWSMEVPEEDNSETEWSIIDTKNTSNIEEIVQINEVSSSGVQEENTSMEHETIDSMKKYDEREKVECSLGKSEEELETPAPRKKKAQNKFPTRFIHTRQYDRRTRSRKVFGVDNDVTPKHEKKPSPKESESETKDQGYSKMSRLFRCVGGRPKPFKVRVPVETIRPRVNNKENATEQPQKRQLRNSVIVPKRFKNDIEAVDKVQNPSIHDLGMKLVKISRKSQRK